MTSTVVYTGQLRTEATHLASGNQIITDAPTDNHGRGEAFSPTDLVATALANCMLTVMGIAANTHNIDIDGTVASVEKIMASDPRRIQRINVKVQFPDRPYTPKEKSLLEHTALTCPVAKSLHPDLVQDVSFVWA